MLHQIRANRRCLSGRERRLLLDIAEAALPAGKVFRGADESTVDKVDEFLAALPVAAQRGYSALLMAVESTAVLTERRRFHSLSAERRRTVLESWRTAGIARRWGLRGLLSPLKVAHFDNPEFYKHIGCVYEFDQPAGEAQPRYMRERVHAAGQLDEDLELEVDAVVIGTGAGGAVVARELAEQGHAVIMLEDGAFFDRRGFDGRAFDAQRRMYRNAGATFSLGNVGIPIPIGKTVGGSTTINSGTCYRMPTRVIRKWREELGLTDFTDDHLDPYYERVESVLRVETARAEHLGGVATVIARGCDALGYDHKPLRRNAPDCDGKGVCCFGCPTDAKRSTNVSYVPLAIKAGAELFHGAKAERILIEGGRAVGVVATARGGRSITVRARAVVVSCGSLMTPVLLSQNRLCGRSGQLGGNLSIHPASATVALFDDDISGFNAIPQGYAIEEFHDEGLLFEGGSMPLEVGIAILPFVGPKLIELAEAYDHVAGFGFMVEDTSRGRVRNVRGQPVITYMLNDRDVARLKRGVEILARVFLAAGAKAVYPMVHGFAEVRNEADLGRFRHHNLSARDFELTAYHPLGTARMGPDPSSSVVDSNNQAHDVPGLYIVDGSSVPSSIAVNPQVTIMALATRAAERIGARL